MGIDKRSGSVLDDFNQTGGVDTRLVFFKDWFVDAHMAGTQSPGYPSGASDVGAALSYRSNWLDGIVERRKTGPNFNPEVGFIQRADSNETYGDLTFKVRPIGQSRSDIAGSAWVSGRLSAGHVGVNKPVFEEDETRVDASCLVEIV